MDFSRFALLLILVAGVLFSMRVDSMNQKPKVIVIAHRGASGYLPEHTLVSKTMAFAQGADFIEQDVVLTRDNQPVVLHDIHLDTVTNVKEVFPDRKRSDGRYYVIDFSLAELRQLQVHERIDLKTGLPVFASRFPGDSDCRFGVATLAEELALIQGLNRSTGCQVGIYPEIKQPAWHRKEGKDISRIVLDLLARHGYREKNDLCFLQCFDPAETRRLREELGSQLRLVQLIGENPWNEADIDFDQMRTPNGIRQIAEYADGIGPSMGHVVTGVDSEGKALLTDLVETAHQHGLQVHPYTFRADSLPDYGERFDEVVRMFSEQAKIDGLFTDFPDLAVDALQQ